jgi:hypothetical protein
MAIIKTIPSTRLINGEILETSEISIVSEREYRTNGEECIIIRNVSESTVILDSKTTDHIVVKSMTRIIIHSSPLVIGIYYLQTVSRTLNFSCHPSSAKSYI